MIHTDTKQAKKSLQKKEGAELTPKQWSFVREYIKDYNATRAAIRAGYSRKTAQEQGSRLLSKVMVCAAIHVLEKQIEYHTLITKKMVLQELALIGFSTIKDHLTIDEDGSIRAVALDAVPQGANKAVKKIKERRVIKSRPGSDDVVLVSNFEIELHDKLHALVQMGRELGMFRGRKEEGIDEEAVEKILEALPPEYAEAVRKKILETEEN
jgi:phage terminase small subunit